MPFTNIDFDSVKGSLIELFPGYIREDVEDAFSIACEAIIRRDREEEAIKNLQGYLYRTMKYTLIQESKNRKKETTAKNYISSYTETSEDAFIILENPETEIMDKTVLRVLLEGMSRELSARKQQVLKLYINGDNDKQIAAKIGCTRGTVRSTKAQAVNALRARVGDRNLNEILRK